MGFYSVVKPTSIAVTNFCLDIEELFHHLGHCGAFFRAIATSLGTGSHLFVVRKLLACGSAVIAAFCAAFTSVRTQITLPSTKRSAHLTAFCAVHAQAHAFRMLFFSFGYQFRAIG